MPRIIKAHWEFHCPECGFGHHEIGQLAQDHEFHCMVCEHESGQMVVLHRWLVDSPARPQARLRVVLPV